jgi:hypothetical protein
VKRNDAELAEIMRRFLRNPENYIGTNGPPSDTALTLDGNVDLRNEDELRAVQEVRDGWT